MNCGVLEKQDHSGANSHWNWIDGS